jgi:hypothetical protein
MTVSDLLERMTPEELVLWQMFLVVQHEEHEKAMRNAARRR